MNKVKCLYCGEVMESTYVHDFKMCGCPNQTFVDGGNEYHRVGGRDLTWVAVMRNGEWTSLAQIERGM